VSTGCKCRYNGCSNPLQRRLRHVFTVSVVSFACSIPTSVPAHFVYCPLRTQILGPKWVGTEVGIVYPVYIAIILERRMTGVYVKATGLRESSAVVVVNTLHFTSCTWGWLLVELISERSLMCVCVCVCVYLLLSVVSHFCLSVTWPAKVNDGIDTLHCCQPTCYHHHHNVLAMALLNRSSAVPPPYKVCLVKIIGA